MSETQLKPWSDNPYAPKIPYIIYSSEKTGLAGIFVASILYGKSYTPPPSIRLYVINSFVLGTLVVLFFQCMTALLDPINRKRDGIKWGLVCYTVVMFSCATLATGTAQNLISHCFIDNREFPGFLDIMPPGPIGYQWFIYSKPLSIVPNFASLSNYWLADGFLVGCLFLCPLAHLSNATPPPAPSLLRNLC